MPRNAAWRLGVAGLTIAVAVFSCFPSVGRCSHAVRGKTISDSVESGKAMHVGAAENAQDGASVLSTAAEVSTAEVDSGEAVTTTGISLLTDNEISGSPTASSQNDIVLQKDYGVPESHKALQSLRTNLKAKLGDVTKVAKDRVAGLFSSLKSLNARHKQDMSAVTKKLYPATGPEGRPDLVEGADPLEAILEASGNQEK